jgi:hypothetical protein
MGVPVVIEDNRYANAPIPSYEEAIEASSRSGPSEISDDAERQGLLGQSSSRTPNNTHTRGSGYHAPTVESPRSSLDSDLSVPEMVGDREEDARRHVDQFDYLEPGESEEGERRQARLYHRAKLRNKVTQGLANLSATLSALRLPSFRSLYAPVAATEEGDAAESQPPTTPPTTSSWISRLRDRARVPIPD